MTIVADLIPNCPLESWLLPITRMIILVALVLSPLTALDLDHLTWGQQSNNISQIQESLDNISSQMGEELDRLKMIGEEFAELRQAKLSQSTFL